MEDFQATVPAQARRHGRTFGGSYPQIIFLFPPNFVVLGKICFEHITKTKISPLKYTFPPNLKIWLRA